jgi:hypothetical protein
MNALNESHHYTETAQQHHRHRHRHHHHHHHVCNENNYNFLLASILLLHQLGKPTCRASSYNLKTKSNDKFFCFSFTVTCISLRNVCGGRYPHN